MVAGRSLSAFERQLNVGSLRLRLPGGNDRQLGWGEPAAEMRIHRRSTLNRILSDPEMALGDTYVTGEWDAGQGGLIRIFEVLLRNRVHGGPGIVRGLLARLARLTSRPGLLKPGRANAQAHYDLGNELFAAFLDSSMQYSCAYFADGTESLEEAQQAKCRHIARKLMLKPGMHVLDIGCGWGGLALYLARHSDVHVTGTTLSYEQLQIARRRVQEAGLTNRVSFRLADYRELSGQYDAIVSVGMLEHAGRTRYQTYFDIVDALLKKGGTALIHTIGRYGPPSRRSNWITKRIFPGGEIPSLSELAPCIEESGLVLCDLEVLRLHHAQTLSAWNRRFQRVRPVFAENRGAAFCRMWEFYLALSEALFRWGGLAVFQIQAAHLQHVVPLTRDYLYHPRAQEPEAQSGDKVIWMSR